MQDLVLDMVFRKSLYINFYFQGNIRAHITFNWPHRSLSQSLPISVLGPLYKGEDDVKGFGATESVGVCGFVLGSGLVSLLQSGGRSSEIFFF